MINVRERIGLPDSEQYLSVNSTAYSVPQILPELVSITWGGGV